MQPCYYLLIQSQCGLAQLLKAGCSMKDVCWARGLKFFFKILAFLFGLAVDFSQIPQWFGCWWSWTQLELSPFCDALVYLLQPKTQKTSWKILDIGIKTGFALWVKTLGEARANASKWPKTMKFGVDMALIRASNWIGCWMVTNIIGHQPLSTRPLAL